MMMQPIRGRDVEALLARALLAHAAAAGLDAHIADARSRPWASATYTGTRHTLDLACERHQALGRWVADLPLAELPMRGHLLASVAVDRIDDDGENVVIGLTFLTLEDV